MRPVPPGTAPDEARVGALGQRLCDAIDVAAAATRRSWLDALIERSIQDRRFRLQTLRFIDVLPALHGDATLLAHLQEYFTGLELPWPVLGHWSLQHGADPWAMPVAAPLVRATLRGVARRFMGGGTLRQVLQTVARLQARGMRCNLDLLGEAVLGEAEADAYLQAYLELLAELGGMAPAMRPDVSLKLSSLSPCVHPADPQGSSRAINARLRPILTAARTHGVAVTVDMEQFDSRHIVLRCFRELLMEEGLRDWPQAGIAVQAYLRDARASLRELIDWAATRGTPVRIRLVRGAYWDTETVLARQQGWLLPVWERKAQTDACYEACLALLFAHHGSVIPAVATHNVRSLACAMALAEQHALAADDYEFQMLYGMADDCKQALVGLGYPLRVYVPYGETLPGMAYLVRRLLENTSGQSILDSGVGRITRDARDLRRPLPAPEPPLPATPGFCNCPVHRFTDTRERAAFRAALAAAGKQTGRDYQLLIDDNLLDGEGRITSLNPAHPDQIIGHVACAGPRHAGRALAAAQAALPGWRALPVRERAACLRRAAELLSAQRDDFAAWQVLEAGKHWCEADADVCEAIDFLNYYALQAERLDAGERLAISGEHSVLGYRARGVGLVIAPWNFPLAILTGMLAALLVTGNTAIVKPSSLTPVIAARFIGLLLQAGFPAGVVNFLPGPGHTTGAYLAAHPAVATIAFTGSRAVGVSLLQTAARILTGQTHVKRVLAEMGGKNAIIIDDDADLDAAVPGVLYSAFGFQGQKCSAASRLIVVGSVYRRCIERLCDAVASLRIGDPLDPGNSLGPVIDAGTQRRITDLVAQAGRRAHLLMPLRTDLPARGYFLSPAVFTDVAPDDPLAQEEIFGPVLAVLRADSFEQAVELANGTAYALTGGVYSRRPSHLDHARRTFEAGNLYLNRAITGAKVGRHPFGGYRLSGTGSKAGGADYLKLFTDPQCITENTLRRGFAPAAGET